MTVDAHANGNGQVVVQTTALALVAAVALLVGLDVSNLSDVADALYAIAFMFFCFCVVTLIHHRR